MAFDLSRQRTRQKTGRKHDDKRNRIALVISRQSKSRFGKHKIKGQHRRQRGDQAAALPLRHDGDNLHAENINRDDICFTESDLSKSQRKQCTDCQRNQRDPQIFQSDFNCGNVLFRRRIGPVALILLIRNNINIQIRRKCAELLGKRFLAPSPSGTAGVAAAKYDFGDTGQPCEFGDLGRDILPP